MKKLTTALIILSLLLTACTSSSSGEPGAASPPPAEANLPDLEVTDVEPVEDGVKITVENSGTADAGEFNVKIELSKGGQNVGEFSKKVSGIPAGEEKVVKTSFSGAEYVLGYIIVDSYNTVVESDEENNEFGF